VCVRVCVCECVCVCVCVCDVQRAHALGGCHTDKVVSLKS